ncbi:MAG: RND family transporter [Nitrospinota bacterium]
MSKEMNAGERINHRIEEYGRWVIRWRWPIVIATLLVTALIGSGVRFLTFSTNYRVFFSEENPQLESFESLQNIYTKNDNILFVLAPKDGEVFTEPTLEAVKKLTAEAWKIPYAIRVDAVTNFQHTYANGDDLIVKDLVYDVPHLSPETLKEARDIAVSEPLLINRLISSRANVTGVNVTLQLPGKDMTEVPKAVGYARELAEKIRSDSPEIEIYITGLAMLNNAFSEASITDMQTLMPLMYLVMMLIMFIFLRSVSATLATFLLISLSAMVAMGFAGFFRVGLTPPSAQSPTIIMALAIADSIHFLVIMLREMGNGKSKRDAIVESLRINMQPIFLTSLSTVIGFLSMNFSNVPPFHHLGNITAAGVTAAFGYSVFFLPALMAILPVRPKKQVKAVPAIVEYLSNFVVSRHRPLLWISTAAALLLLAFIPGNELDDRFLENFDRSIRFRADTDFAVDNMTGIYQIEYSLSSGESGGISNPAYLAKLEEFADWYRQQPGVKHVNTFTDIMKRLNMNLHGDDSGFYRIPDQRELAAQYLLLYEMSLPYGLDLNNQINVDKSATRFTVTLEDMSAKDIRASTEHGQQWLRENAKESMFSYGSGPSVMFAYISGINVKSMLIGSFLALILISGLLIFALRSFKIGFLSLIPNLLPIAMAFGVWKLLSGRIDIGISMVMGMTLGIVVDDTIHFLSKYLRAHRENGLDTASAVRYAFSTVGMALFVTSVILIVGFGILSLSTFGMTGNMARLTAITIALALLGDFFLLPSLLMRLDRKNKRSY